MKTASRPNSTKLLIGAIAASAVGAFVVACGGGGSDEPINVTSGTVFKNATVINTRDGSLQSGVTVVVDGGKIRTITARFINPIGTAVAIDATGKFIVPGFMDMHTHYYDSPVGEQAAAGALLIANGITAIREMRGSAEIVQSAKQLNADSAAGRVDAPEILIIPGEIIGLNAVPASQSAAAAIQEVQKQKAYGAGYIKTVRANRDATLAFLAEAKNQGLHVAGHLSQSVSAKESSDLGWRAVEHLGAGLSILLDCSSNEDALRAGVVAGTTSTIAARQPILDTYSDSKCQALAQTFAKNGTWHVPTLIRLRTGSLATDDTLYRTDPNLVYVSKATRAAWEGAAVAYGQANDAASAARLRTYYDKLQTLPKLLKANGVKMLAGSDTSVIATWVIPGFSLHQEFKLLAASGLKPLEILQMTTINVAEFFSRESTMGTVEEGKNADLVLLDANPLADIANLDKISAVVLKGKYFSKAALDKMKSDVATMFANQPLESASLAVANTHVD